jgi:hypothetical protein
MGVLVSGTIVTTDGFEIPSAYICLERMDFRKESGFSAFPPVSYLSFQFNCYKSREDKISLKKPIQLPDMFSRLFVQNAVMYMDPYAISYSELCKKLTAEGYTTSVILETDQVDGSLYIYNSEGVSRPTA